MRIKLESRDKLKDGVDKRKRGLDDREKHMGGVVKEKKAIADASRKLRFPTKEGAAEIIRYYNRYLGIRAKYRTS